ncbi:MAG: hypothetical protein ABIG36_10320 [Pseudomonadota bacterium]
MALLSDIEDRLLAMCEGDPVTIKLAQTTLGVWYERAFGNTEIVQVANRLAKLGLLKWQHRRNNKRYFAKSFPCGCIAMESLTFQATKAGEAHLAKPRKVIEH